MKLYTVYTGQKLKGCWTDEKQAIDYMAARDEVERKAWKLLSVDVSKDLSAAVAARVKELSVPKQPAKGVHHLKAQSIEASSKGSAKPA